MSLATRCTACGTVFRIVEDQLRVSDGWVRCGRCAEIFDARELLFDIEREAPPPWPAPFTSEAVAEQLPPTPPPPPPPPPPQAPPPSRPEPAWIPPPEPESPTDALPTGWPNEHTRHEPRWEDTDEPAQAPPLPQRRPEPSPQVPKARVAAAPVVMPEFMRRAESTARWNRPAMKLALGLLSVVLALLMALQITLHFRDALSAVHPPLRGGLQALCDTFGCTVEPWRRIESLSIESTSLNPVGSSGGYKLNLSLRNKTGIDVAAPWIELSLTDVSGTPFARRVVAPEMLVPHLTQVAAESEQGLSFSFNTGGQRASGYSVNIFYP
jgi:predicted Zn finger-like uncharacterized protein